MSKTSPLLMCWKNLMSPERERKPSPHTGSGDHRNPFDMDYDRIVYSSSIRRLQDKTQVFPLQENDFTRTRLTHSLETSAIGRSLGAKIGRWLVEHDPDFDSGLINHLSSLLMVTGLVHDLGNPPFGHYGEEVIKNWFANPQNTHTKELTPDELSDFTLFDGNAQTIRILARLQFLRDRHGINFCFGTMGTLLKYPWPSSDRRAKDTGKFGYFKSEANLTANIIESTGLTGRHPATYILEAADDIAYLFADLEDAVKKGHLPWREVCDELLADNDMWQNFPKARESFAADIKHLAESDVPREEMPLIGSRYFKIIGQGLSINAAFAEFTENYKAVMNGIYSRKTILDGEQIKPFISQVRKICYQYAYRNREVLTLELIGKSVLTTLLDKFVPAALDPARGDTATESGKLISLISKNFDYVQRLDEKHVCHRDRELSPYQRVQMVVDFISGMTDSYALNLHKKLLGLILT